MPSQSRQSWLDARPDALPDSAVLAYERELDLVDRVIGLEQQLAELRETAVIDPSARVSEERNLAAMRSSLTWRVGRLVMLPVRVAKYAKRVVFRR